MQSFQCSIEIFSYQISVFNNSTNPFKIENWMTELKRKDMKIIGSYNRFCEHFITFLVSFLTCFVTRNGKWWWCFLKKGSFWSPLVLKILRNVYVLDDMHRILTKITCFFFAKISIFRYAIISSDTSFIDAYLETKVKDFLYNGGKGKLVTVTELVKLRNKVIWKKKFL